MSDIVRLSSKLAADEDLNGLDAWAGTLRNRDVVVAVVALDCPRITINTETNDQVPTARVRWIEPLGEIHDVPDAVRDAVQRARETRLGRAPIPFLEVDAHQIEFTED